MNQAGCSTCMLLQQAFPNCVLIVTPCNCNDTVGHFYQIMSFWRMTGTDGSTSWRLPAWRPSGQCTERQAALCTAHTTLPPCLCVHLTFSFTESYGLHLLQQNSNIYLLGLWGSNAHKSCDAVKHTESGYYCNMFQNKMVIHHLFMECPPFC